VKKFEKEFNICYSNIDRDNNKPALNYEDFCLFLNLFGCLSNSTSEDLIKELWTFMEGATRNGISRNNLLLALKAILHIDVASQPQSVNPATAQFSQEGELQLSEKQYAMLHKKFYEFYVNKRYATSNELYSKKEQGDEKPVAGTFKPQISKKTEELAAIARGKIDENKDMKLEEIWLKQYKMLGEYLICGIRII